MNFLKYLSDKSIKNATIWFLVTKTSNISDYKYIICVSNQRLFGKLSMQDWVPLTLSLFLKVRENFRKGERF